MSETIAFDIVYVSYNSSKWIQKCFDSWKNVLYDMKKINIYVVDNASTDNSVRILTDVQTDMGDRFGTFRIISENRNWGFGKANNIGFAAGDSQYFCFINMDTEMFPDTMAELEK